MTLSENILDKKTKFSYYDKENVEKIFVMNDVKTKRYRMGCYCTLSRYATTHNFVFCVLKKHKQFFLEDKTTRIKKTRRNEKEYNKDCLDNICLYSVLLINR